MGDAPPPHWSAPGWEGALDAALAFARALATAGRPAGELLPAGWTLVRERPMRVVATGPTRGPDGETPVYAKVRRPVTFLDRARRRLAQGRSAAEGALLVGLRARGVAVPEALGWAEDAATGAGVVLVRAVPAARPLADVAREPLPRAERRRVAEDVGRLLRAAHDAGWRANDLHRGNVLVTPRGAVLLDPGTRRLRGSPVAARRVLLLGIAGHGLGADARSGLAALRAYARGDRAEARRLLALAAASTKAVARAYRRGRSRRATRDGLHFETFVPAGAGSAGVRARASSPDGWKALAASWLHAPPAGARALKADGSVVAARLPGAAAEVAVKRWGPSWKDRLRTPRPLRAFRRAYALRVRGVPCPESLLAAADGRGAGFCVSAWAAPDGLEAIDLARATAPERGRPSPLERLPPAERRAALLRLGRFLRRMHDAEVSHRDLKAPNVVAVLRPEGPEYRLVDLEGARVLRRPVPWTRRARDLARLDASVGSPPVSRADRRRVLEGYFAPFERAPMALPEFARRVAAASARKRAPSGRPR